MQHLGSESGQLQHLVVSDGIQLSGIFHYPRICRVDPVHICIDFTFICMENSCQSHCRGVGASSSEGGDILIFVHTLEPCDNNNLAGVQLMADPLCIDGLESGISIPGSGVHLHLERIQGNRRNMHGIHGHGHQSHRYLLSRCHEHIQLSLFRLRVDSFRKGDQIVRSVSHSGQHDDHVMPFPVILNAALGHIVDPVFVSDGSSAEFFYNQHLLFSLSFIFHPAPADGLSACTHPARKGRSAWQRSLRMCGQGHCPLFGCHRSYREPDPLCGCGL